MTVRFTIALAALSGLIACDFTKSGTDDSSSSTTDDSGSGGPGTAMTPGTYNLVFEQVYSNTCSQYEFTTGGAERVTLSSTSDSITINSGNGSFSFDVDGDSFSRELDGLDGTYDPCFIRLIGEEEGQIVGPEFAEFTQDSTESTEGNCSAYDVTGWPCSYSLGFRLERVGD
ncbi:MAG: hypothetical protein H6740_10260 [Alphaproteobacteria bacterium]|nr:hypothetical protein [Alphaproteobacteria bacterium]